ncbi:hypothetical protein ACLUWM_04890 [Limosilactobacillus mucosae]
MKTEEMIKDIADISIDEIEWLEASEAIEEMGFLKPVNQSYAVMSRYAGLMVDAFNAMSVTINDRDDAEEWAELTGYKPDADFPSYEMGREIYRMFTTGYFQQMASDWRSNTRRDVAAWLVEAHNAVADLLSIQYSGDKQLNYRCYVVDYGGHEHHYPTLDAANADYRRHEGSNIKLVIDSDVCYIAEGLTD